MKIALIIVASALLYVVMVFMFRKIFKRINADIDEHEDNFSEKEINLLSAIWPFTVLVMMVTPLIIFVVNYIETTSQKLGIHNKTKES